MASSVRASTVTLCWLLRHGASHALPDKTTLSHGDGDPWEGTVTFLVGDVIAPGHIVSV